MELKAVYSRSKSSAEALIEGTNNVDLYYSTDASNTQNLDALLSRRDIQGVIIALPILVQPEIIKKCLQAGKHVMSEKPLAASVEICRSLLKFHSSLNNPPIFMVAEQFRYDCTIEKAAQIVREKLGKLYCFSLELYAPVVEDDKFYNTPWRKTPDYQGGFLLDGGVHFIAGLRRVLGRKVNTVSGFSRQIQPHTPPVDTLHAVIKLEDGATGVLGLSWGCKSILYEMRVLGEAGTLKVGMGHLDYQPLSGDKEVFEFKEPGGGMDAVRREMAFFASAISNGKADPLGIAEEGMRDVAMVSTSCRVTNFRSNLSLSLVLKEESR